MSKNKFPKIINQNIKELITLLLTFLKLGAFTFGGGYAMISLLRESVVEKKGWVSDEEMLEIIGIAESTPGPIAINMATYIGYRRAKILGAFIATLGVVLPSLVIIFVISLFFEAFLQNVYVVYAFAGIKVGVAILIINAGLDMIKKIEKKALPIIVLLAVIIIMITIEIFSFTFSSIILILLGGFIGIVANQVKKLKEAKK